MVELVRPMVSEGKAEEEPGENPNASRLVGGLVSNWNRDFSATLNFVPVTPSLVPDLRSLNSTLFPMTYNERYYKEVLAIDSLSRIVYWGSKVAATFSCRLQVFHVNDMPKIECYVMTFGVLAAFRRLKIGTVMLEAITEYYRRRIEVSRIALHVHSCNQIALNFYLKHEFILMETMPDYYKRLSPSSAHLLHYVYAR